jgi:hypothetical protein
MSRQAEFLLAGGNFAGIFQNSIILGPCSQAVCGAESL